MRYTIWEFRCVDEFDLCVVVFRSGLARNYSVTVSGIDLLITIDETNIPTINGSAKHNTWRNLAEPDETDSATNGSMNDANMAIDHIAAFVPMSFFFCPDVMKGNPGSYREVRVRMPFGRITFKFSECEE
jgi:hypothetical protein